MPERRSSCQVLLSGFAKVSFAFVVRVKAESCIVDKGNNLDDVQVGLLSWLSLQHLQLKLIP